MNCHVELPSGPNEKQEMSDREDYVGDESILSSHEHNKDYVGDESILSSYEQYTGGAERDEKNKEESKEKHKNVVSNKLFFVFCFSIFLFEHPHCYRYPRLSTPWIGVLVNESNCLLLL